MLQDEAFSLPKGIEQDQEVQMHDHRSILIGDRVIVYKGGRDLEEG